MSEFVNIVILVRDRFRLAEQAITTLHATTPRDRFRLMVVDDGSEDFRMTRLLAMLDRDTVIRVQGSGHRVGKLKTLGVQAARVLHGQGEWLYLGDGDTAFLPGWLDRMLALMQGTEKFNFKLWGGQLHPFHHGKEMGYGHAANSDEFLTTPSVPFVETEVLDGPSWMMRWSTWDEIGPLAGEAPGPCQSEDAEWCARLRRSGGRIGVVTPHVVVHTGLSQTDGRDAPGRAEREKTKVQGVLYE